MTDWMDGKTAPQNGVQFIAAWRVPTNDPNSILIRDGKVSRPGGIIDVSMGPGDARLLQRVWWDGKNVYSDPDYWMPLPGAKP